MPRGDGRGEAVPWEGPVHLPAAGGTGRRGSQSCAAWNRGTTLLETRRKQLHQLCYLGSQNPKLRTEKQQKLGNFTFHKRCQQGGGRCPLDAS